MDTVATWQARGARRALAGHDIFVIDRAPATETAEPILLLHGFPTCSFDWRGVIDLIARQRRVITLDFLGFGLSAKPDQRYSLFEQADIVQALLEQTGLDRFALVTHDMGDSVGGEILARSLDGTLGADITGRVITNGSIYMDLVQLSAGQQFLLALPDQMLPAEQAPDRELYTAGVASTFAPDAAIPADELEAQWALCEMADGHRLLPRLIRYVEERHEHEERWTGAIERHPSPLSIVWGALDPIAVIAMANRLAGARADAALTIFDDVGHYPMIEAPERLAGEIVRALGEASGPDGR